MPSSELSVHIQLAEPGVMVEELSGRRARSFATLLGEPEDVDLDPVARNVLRVERTFCPDLLVELLLLADAVFKPAVLLAEYVFMTRAFKLMRPDLRKVVDTHDVFSTRPTKVAQFGITDSIGLTPEHEARMLDRADLLIGIQPEEAAELHKLAPRRPVITIGVDFELLEQAPLTANRPVVLLVASANPMNEKGLSDFLRFAWPLIYREVSGVELQVVGSVGKAVDHAFPGVRILGVMDSLAEAYAEAQVVVNLQ